MSGVERARRFRAVHGPRVNLERRQQRRAAAPALSVVTGSNADLIREVCKLHLGPEDSIADLTFGRGTFWKGVAAGIRARVTGSDLVTVCGASVDFRATPYADRSFDIVVLDPPYIPSVNSHTTAERYQHGTIEGLTPDSILALYVAGMTEAKRIARKQIWVKCKDQVAGGKQIWQHVDILREAAALGMAGRDLFILHAKGRTMSMGRWKSQEHARKTHSYLWVFGRPPGA